MQRAANSKIEKNRMALHRFVLLLASAMWAPLLHAGGIEELQAFIEQTRSARATFTQTVTDSQGVTIQDSSGVVEFSRPGRFRWHYLEPFEQLVIGDGTNLWVYDKDLAQATTRKLGRALGSSPAALLAGSDDVERYFSLESMGRQGGHEWLEVVPNDEESLFEKVRMGFSDSTLQIMELYDHFGQKTVILFSEFKRNPKFAPDAFTFTPPPGVDVVTD
jgi:outer membrane lipoprotein carrier protein